MNPPGEHARPNQQVVQASKLEIDHRSKPKCNKCRGDKKKCTFGGIAPDDPGFDSHYELGMVCDGCLKGVNQEERIRCQMFSPIALPVTKVAGARRPTKKTPRPRNQSPQREMRPARGVESSSSHFSGSQNGFPGQRRSERIPPASTVRRDDAFPAREISARHVSGGEIFQHNLPQPSDPHHLRASILLEMQGEAGPMNVVGGSEQWPTERLKSYSFFEPIVLTEIFPGSSHKRTHRDGLVNSGMNSSQEDLSNNVNRPRRRRQKSNGAPPIRHRAFNALDLGDDSSTHEGVFGDAAGELNSNIQSTPTYQRKGETQGFAINNNTGRSQKVLNSDIEILKGGPSVVIDGKVSIPGRRIDKECEIIYGELKKANAMIRPGPGVKISACTKRRFEKLAQSLTVIASILQKGGIDWLASNHKKTARNVLSRIQSCRVDTTEDVDTLTLVPLYTKPNISLRNNSTAPLDPDIYEGSSNSHDIWDPMYLDKETRDQYGNMGHHLAVWMGDQDLLQELVVDCKWYPDFMNYRGETLLIIAAIKNDVQMVEFLLNAGALPDGDDCCDFTTPLCEAVDRDHVEVARLLIKRGANPNKPVQKHCRTPYAIATESFNTEMMKLFDDIWTDPYQFPHQLGISEVVGIP